MKASAYALLFIGLDQLAVTLVNRYAPAWLNSQPDRWQHAFSYCWSLLLALLLFLLLAGPGKLLQRSWLACALLFAGLASNALTYLRFHQVVDYIPLPTTYINAADLMIAAGCGMAVAVYLKNREKPI